MDYIQETLAPLTFLLLFTLYVALNMLSGPVKFLKKTWILNVGQGLISVIFRLIAGLVRLVIRGRRRRVHRRMGRLSGNQSR